MDRETPHPARPEPLRPARGGRLAAGTLALANAAVAAALAFLGAKAVGRWGLALPLLLYLGSLDFLGRMIRLRPELLCCSPPPGAQEQRDNGEEPLADVFLAAAAVFAGLYLLMMRFSIYFLPFATLAVLFELRRRGLTVTAQWQPGEHRITVLTCPGQDGEGRAGFYLLADPSLP